MRIYNYIALWRSRESNNVPMVAQAGKKFFAATNCESFSFSCKIEGDVPVSRKRSGGNAGHSKSEENDFFHGITNVMKKVAASAVARTIR